MQDEIKKGNKEMQETIKVSAVSCIMKITARLSWLCIVVSKDLTLATFDGPPPISHQTDCILLLSKNKYICLHYPCLNLTFSKDTAF